MSTKSGIYIIHSFRFPFHLYVGSAVNLQQRQKRHIRELKAGKHFNPILQNHVRKYGIDDLWWETILFDNNSDLLFQEQIYIDVLHPYFNICPIAGSRAGTRQTNGAKLKIKKSMFAQAKENIIQRYRRLCGLTDR